MAVSYEGFARGLFAILDNFKWLHVTILRDIHASIYYELLGPAMMLVCRQQYTKCFPEIYTFDTNERSYLVDVLLLAKSRSRGTILGHQKEVTFFSPSLSNLTCSLKF